MADFTAGSASISIRPDLTGFHKKIKMTLRSERIEAPVNVVPELGEFAEKLRTKLSKVNANVKVGIAPDMTGFATDLRTRLKGVSARMDVRINPNLSGFKTDLRDRLAGMNNPKVSIPVDLDLTQAKLQLAAFRVEIAQAVRADFDLDITAALAQIAALRAAANGVGSSANLGSIGGAAGGMVNPIQMATMALGALAAVNLVPLIGQLAQAAGVVSLLPAVAASAAAGIATIVIGSTGMMDAFKAGSKAADDAAKNGAKAAKQAAADAKAQASAQKAVASAARGVESAQDGVARAERGVQTAQKQSLKAQQDLTRARKDAKEQIEDLNLSLKGSALDERSAVLAVQRAEQRLRELGKDGSPVTTLDLSEAVLGVDEAKQRLDEVRERNADLRDETEAANKAGVEGSEQVVAAKEKVADADQGVVDAQKAVLDSQQSLLDAQQNLTDAQLAAAEATSSSADAVDEYAAALANLSPNARKFVEDTRSLGSAWKDLRLQVQDNLFADLGTSLTNFANSALPTLKGGLSGIATEINLGLRRAIDDLSTESTKLDWTKILENTRLAIGPVIDGLSNLWGSLTNIAAIGSEFLPGFGKSFSDVMSEFRAWTESPDGQNKIRDFMKDSIEALKEVKDLFLSLGRVVGGLFSTSEKNGKSMFQSMTDGLNKFADWMNTPEGAERMQKFWDDAQQTATDLLTLVGQAIQLADKLSKLTGNNFGLTDPNREPAPGGHTNQVGPVEMPMKPGGFDDSPAGSRVVDAFGGRDNWERFIDGFTEGGYDKKLGMLQSFGAFAQNMIPGLTQAKALGGELVEQFGVVKDKTIELGQAFVDEVSTKASAAWTTLSDKITSTWNTNISPAIEAFKRDGLSGLANHFVSTITNGSVLTWQELPNAIGAGVAEMAEKHFPGLTNALTGVKDFFGVIVDGIRNKWDELKVAAAEPINWIISTVINGSLKNAWNAVAGVIPGLKTWDGVANVDVANTGAGKGANDKPMAGMYTGGIIPGYTPGKDTTTIAVGGGEAVMRPEWTRAMGPDYVNTMNQAARVGGVEGVKNRMQHFASGGIVQGGAEITSPIQQAMWDAVRTAFPQAQLTSGTRYEDVGSGFDNHMGQRAIDLGGPMTEIARWIYQMNNSQPVLELIHAPLDGWENLKNGSPLNYGASTDADHYDHVHWAMDSMVNSDGRLVFDGGGGSVLDKAGRVLSSGVNSARAVAASAFETAANAVGSSIPDFGSSMMGQIPRAVFDGIKGAMSSAIRGNMGSGGSSDAGNTPFNIGAGAEQWRPNVIEALKREGYEVNDQNINLTLSQIQSESSGNPNAIQQVQDVNSGGNEAVGLLQIAKGTWAGVRNPDLPDDRTNPDASISAGLRYMKQKHDGNLAAMWGQQHGYANGGIIPGYTPGTDKYQIAVGGGEAVMRPEWTRGVGKPYVDNMNYIARTQGVDGVRKAARFAAGGVVDPNKFLLDRLGQFGSQVGDIAKSAIPEILGVQGTVLDPSHRYWQAAMDIQSAVQSTQATAPGSNLQNIPAPLNGGPQPAPMPGTGNEFHFHVADVESALQKTQLMLKQQQLAFTRR